MKLWNDFHAQHIKGSSVFSRPVMQQSTLAAVVSILIYLFCQRPDAKLNNVGENGEMYFRCALPLGAPLLATHRSPTSALPTSTLPPTLPPSLRPG